MQPTETAFRCRTSSTATRRGVMLACRPHATGCCRIAVVHAAWACVRTASTGSAASTTARSPTLRHDELLLHNVIRDGVGLAYRQQHGLPAAERTIPDLLIYLDNQAFLCDVTVIDTLADGNLACSRLGPSRLADKKAEGKERKYRRVAAEMQAVHLPFAEETMGGLSESALQLMREIHHSASTHCTRRDADAIDSHLLDSVAVAVQRCTSKALRASVQRETVLVMSARAA